MKGVEIFHMSTMSKMFLYKNPSESKTIGDGNWVPRWHPSWITGQNGFPGLSRYSYLIHSLLIHSSETQTM